MSCSLIAEMVAWAKNQQKDVLDLMEEIHLLHNVFLEDLISITKKGRKGEEEISKMMRDIRKKAPKKIAGEDVVQVIDYLEPKQTGLPKSNVIQIITNKGTKVTARPSGTEPKIKFYFSVQEKAPTKQEYEEVNKKLKKKIEKIKQEISLN